MPTGTLTQKNACQLKLVPRQPPRVGPVTDAPPATAPQTPKAAPLRLGAKMLVRMVRVWGVKIAPPAPWTARAAISWPGFWATLHAIDAPVNTTRPIKKRIFGPYMSPNRPAVIRRTAETRIEAYS